MTCAGLRLKSVGWQLTGKQSGLSLLAAPWQLTERLLPCSPLPSKKQGYGTFACFVTTVTYFYLAKKKATPENCPTSTEGRALYFRTEV